MIAVVTVTTLMVLMIGIGAWSCFTTNSTRSPMRFALLQWQRILHGRPIACSTLSGSVPCWDTSLGPETQITLHYADGAEFKIWADYYPSWWRALPSSPAAES